MLDPILEELKFIAETDSALANLTAFNHIKRNEMDLNTFAKFVQHLEVKVVKDGIRSGQLLTNFSRL